MRYRARPGREWERHPLQAALRHGLQDVAGPCGRRHFTARSKVSDHLPPHRASVFVSKQEVGWLEVPVHDQLTVQVAHAASELTRHVPGGTFLKRDAFRLKLRQDGVRSGEYKYRRCIMAAEHLQQRHHMSPSRVPEQPGFLHHDRTMVRTQASEPLHQSRANFSATFTAVIAAAAAATAAAAAADAAACLPHACMPAKASRVRACLPAGAAVAGAAAAAAAAVALPSRRTDRWREPPSQTCLRR